MSFIVAIDGPAGTGKGAVTKILAEKLGLVNIDTGATYRCVALEVLNKKISLEQKDEIIEISKNIKIELKNENREQIVLLNGKDVTSEIRSKEVTQIVSQVSSIKEVRFNMVDLQRKLAKNKNVIMEGRDITTYVFPNADVKIYLDASLDERVKRRYKQNAEKGIHISLEELKKSMNERDENDKNKEIGSLMIAHDAVYIDTSNLSINEVCNKIGKIIKDKLEDIEYTKKIYAIRPETKWKKFVRRIVKTILNALYHIFYRIKIEGEIPKEGACIVCANHLNYIDAAAIVLFNKRKVMFVARETLFYSRILNWLAHLFDIIPIKRGKQDMEAMKRSLKVLSSGQVLGIFPEGTRKGLAKNAKIGNGAAYMALRTGTKVVPVGISGSFKPFTKVYIRYGEPIVFEKQKNPDKEQLQFATNQIMETIIMLTNKKD